MQKTQISVNPAKTGSIRVLGQFDVAALQRDVLAIPEETWRQENAEKPNRFDALERTEHIVFRFVSTVSDWRHSYDRPIWSGWRDRIEPLLWQAASPYGYRRGGFPRIMLARMQPGGIIKPHTDSGPAAAWPHKIHIPLLTNKDVRFLIAPNYYHLPQGAAIEVNNMGVHAVRNDGDTARIHLIFEYCDYSDA